MTINLTQDEIADKIRSSALLVSLQLGSYNPVKTDRSESRKVSSSHGINNPKLMRVQKHTLPTAGVLDQIDKLDTKIRSVVDRYTAPFARGIGLLPATKFFDLKKEINMLFDDRDTLVRQLGDEYALYLEGAKQELNGAFKPEDYPPVQSVLSKFTHKLDSFQIANPRDSKLSILGGIADAIQQAASDTLKDKFEAITPFLHELLLDPLLSMSSTLQNPDAIYRDTLFTNVEQAANRANDLNMLEDDVILQACKEIHDKLCIDASSCREDKQMRSMVVNDCNQIIESLGGTIPVPKVVAKKGKQSAPVTLQPCTPEPDDSDLDDQILNELAQDVDPDLQPEPKPVEPEKVSSADPEFNPDALLAKLGW